MAYDTYKCPDFPQCPSLPSHFTCVEVYTVKAGDTLYAISQAYGVPVAVLMQVNRILNPYNLKIGQKICIPGKQCGSSPDSGNGGSDGGNSGNGGNDNSGNGGNNGNNNSGSGDNSGNDNSGNGGGNSDDNGGNGEAEAPECSGTIHVISRGETLYIIAKMYRVPLGIIMRANPELDPYNLRIGQKICIPPFPPQRPDRPSCPERPVRPGGPNTPCRPICGTGRPYVTQRGDTLARILERFDITYGQLLAANPDVDFEESLETLTLCIPAQENEPEDCSGETYTIKNGDSLDSISQKFGVIADRILMANPDMTTSDFSSAGAIICIPD